MSKIISHIQSSSINNDLYSSFLKKKDNQPVKGANNSSKHAGSKQNNKTKKILQFTGSSALGTGIVLLGLFASNKRGTIKRVINLLERQIDVIKSKRPVQFDQQIDQIATKSKEFGLRALEFGKQALNCWQNFDVIKNKGLLSLQNAFAPIRNGLKPITVDLPIWLSGRVTKTKYEGFKIFGREFGGLKGSAKNFKFVSEKVIREYGKDLSPEELETVTRLLGASKKSKKGLIGVVEGLIDGIDRRRETISKVLDNEVVKKYNNEYVPQKLSLADIPGSAREVRNKAKKVAKDFFTKDMSRENWEVYIQKFKDNISGNDNSEKLIKNNVRKIVEILEKTGIKKKNAKLYDSLDRARSSVINSFENAKNFEADNYAGRVLDLKHGGGILEVVSPPLMMVPFAYHLSKDDTKEKKIDRTLNEGVGLAGGISTWMVSSLVLNMNGIKAIIPAFIAGKIFDTAGKMASKFLKRGQNKETTEKPAPAIALNPRLLSSR